MVLEIEYRLLTIVLKFSIWKKGLQTNHYHNFAPSFKKKSGLLIALCKGKAIKNTHIMIALLKETLLNTAWILFNRPLWQHYNDTTIALTRNAIKNQAFNSTFKVLLKRMHLQ